MKINYNSMVGKTALLAVSGLMLTGLSGLAQNTPANWDAQRIHRAMAPNAAAFNGPRQLAGADKIGSSRLFNSRQRMVMAENTPDPVVSIGPTEALYDMDGPNGEIWYYTQECSYVEEAYEWFTDYIMVDYRFDIYDAQMQLRGSIYDMVRYEENEVRVAGTYSGLSLLPIVTQKYFNSDDDYEFMVSLTCNSTTAGNNQTRTYVYKLGGETEQVSIPNPMTGGVYKETEVSKPFFVKEGMICDVLDNSKDGVEDLYISFYSNGGCVTYGHFDEEEGDLVQILEFNVGTLQAQGDQGDTTALMLTFSNEYGAFFVCPKYEKDFYYIEYADEDDDYGDYRMNDPNTLLLDIYKLESDKATFIQHTEIPVSLNTEDSDALYTYYAIGNLMAGGDVIFDNYESEGKLSFVITRFDYLNSADGNGNYGYYIYDSEGTLLRPIFEGAEAVYGLSNLSGYNPQICCVTYDDQYHFNMVDVVTEATSKTVVIDQYVDIGEEELMPVIANMDRVLQADGSYMYAFEMRYPRDNDEGVSYLQVAWFTAKGKFKRVDEVNIGEMVAYATVYVSNAALQPDLFIPDDTQEYMVLIKRYLTEDESSNQEEFIVARALDSTYEDGLTLIHKTPESRGVLSTLGLYPIDGSLQLMISYAGYGYYADFYKLPLFLSADEVEISGIGRTIAETAANTKLAFDGQIISAPGASIDLYNLQGIPVASGSDSLGTANLAPGCYLVKAGSATLKIRVK